MRVSILLMRALVEAVQSIGVPRDRFLAEAGIDEARLQSCTDRLTLEEYERVKAAALTVSGDPALGLHIAERAHSSDFDLLGHLLHHATTLRHALQTLTRYVDIMCVDPVSCTLTESGDRATLCFAFPPMPTPALRLDAELSMGGVLRLLHRFTASDAPPHEVCFNYPAPAHRAEYTRLFAGTERFDQTRTAIVFDRAWLELTQLHKNPELYAVLETEAERALQRIGRDNRLATRVEELIVTHDPPHFPTMHEAARTLGMSPRSLRRRLSTDGITYRELLDRARERVARRLLETPNVSIQEAAFVLGFATPAAFHRAFKRWTDTTPKSYRASY